ncbi:MAG: type III pantothenate kinase [Nocardioidaceae bacterium]|nr:type III pantothenate kinase [Nocardioidaceae bacterium]
MLLCVDIGNSHTGLGLFEGDKLLHQWRVTTAESRTADEWFVLLRGLLRGGVDPGHDVPPGQLGVPTSGIAVCSTVPMVLHEVRQVLERYFCDVPHLIVETGVRTGVPVHMDNPREVGTDRIVNALAASSLFGGPCIVVDVGTATTFDVVSPAGEYVGGAIAPGIEISLEALGRRGSQLRRVELARPRSVIAKNTVEALQSGAVFGFASQVDGVVARMVEALGARRSDVTVVATGGLAPVILDECAQVDAHEPALTLIGLRLVFERNC